MLSRRSLLASLGLATVLAPIAAKLAQAKPAPDFVPPDMRGRVVVPAKWLPCDGRDVSRKLYHELFSVIGTSYGPGDGSATFNLPCLPPYCPAEHFILTRDDPTHGPVGTVIARYWS